MKLSRSLYLLTLMTSLGSACQAKYESAAEPAATATQQPAQVESVSTGTKGASGPSGPSGGEPKADELRATGEEYGGFAEGRAANAPAAPNDPAPPPDPADVGRIVAQGQGATGIATTPAGDGLVEFENKRLQGHLDLPESEESPEKPMLAALPGYKDGELSADADKPVEAVRAGARDITFKERERSEMKLEADAEPSAMADKNDVTLDAELDGKKDLAEDLDDERQEQKVSDGVLAANRRAPSKAPRVTLGLDANAGFDALRNVRPDRVLPRTFYFENTYLGGSAAYAERLRRLDSALAEGDRPYRMVAAEAQPFDAPRTDGLGLSASVDATHFDDPRRVFLQVGIQGSQRYGWRRPPVDAVLVIGREAFASGREAIIDFIAAALAQLTHTDRLGVLVVGENGTEELLGLTRLETARQVLAHRVDSIAAPSSATNPNDHGALAGAMSKAGSMLSAASESPNTVPGTQMVLVLTGETSPTTVTTAASAAHDLTLQGAVTSIFTTSGTNLPWWLVADAGYGNWHRLPEVGAEGAMVDELEALSRVVARLVRVNIRLGRGTSAIRVLGTRVLAAAEVAQVKAREVAADQSLSKTLGIISDRGDDDDGIQTVIPYFLGDDSHVILVELWVEEPGVVADVTLRYKDMVNLDNATARTSVTLTSRPRPEAPEQLWIARNVRGFVLGEELQRASVELRNNATGSASATLTRAWNMAQQTNAADLQAVEDMRTMVERGRYDNGLMGDNLLLSGQRRIGMTRR